MNKKILFILFYAVVLLFMFGCAEQRLSQLEGTVEEKIKETIPEEIQNLSSEVSPTEQESPASTLPDEQTLRAICAREHYPPDCNQIPFPSGVAICTKCKEMGFTYEEQYGQGASSMPLSPSAQTSTDKFITANPFDLSQIARISKFRSCEGHDYSGLNNNREQETLRSMKHYIEPLSQLIGSQSNAKIFAPFNGKVKELRDSPPGKQVFIAADAAPEWNFIFFHVDLLPEVEVGTAVQAGQHIGQASVQIQKNFDVGLKQFGRRGQIFDSLFFYMNDAVLAEYAAKGVTLENIIIAKQTRDADPCQVYGTRPEGDADFGRSRDEAYVRLG